VRFSELEGRAVGVWGAGREITSFAEQLSRRLPGARIVAAAFDDPPDAGVRERLHAPRARVGVGPDARAALQGCEVIVRSPGVSSHRSELRALADGGVAVTTATSLWLAERGGAGMLGVTGTKGKSTTAALAAHLVRAAGRSVRLAGNIGVPAIDLLDAPAGELVVVELSSYQIADLAAGPEVALVTNLFPEHVDWHGSAEAYRAEKLRLLDLPGVRVAVLNGREGPLAALRPPCAVVRYGVRSGWDVLAGAVTRAGEVALAAGELPLAGDHNALNLCGALAAVEELGVALRALRGALADFEPLPHRLQTVAEVDGVLWVDDSISTTPESALAALASFPGRPAVLIAGGQDRGQEFGALGRALARRRAALVAVPTNGGRLLAAAAAAGLPSDRALEAGEMAAAVAAARELAEPGGVVLLSPAAPSYDRYPNFEARGERFCEQVLAAAAGAGAPPA
jgi:UDP-N-acetylmuramoyl-L-alanine---L-glutamate ligase